jgi:eukaryotic-like serine/threonine-protein kinase
MVAHNAGLIRGSVWPQKIILSPDGAAALIGFPGQDAAARPLARYARGADEPAYVSPQQIVYDPVGRRTDLYSLAVVAYSMLVGKDPFGASDGISADNVYYLVLYQPAPHVPEAVLAGLPASVGPASDRAMAKEPQARFSNAGSFL